MDFANYDANVQLLEQLQEFMMNLVRRPGYIVTKDRAGPILGGLLKFQEGGGRHLENAKVK